MSSLAPARPCTSAAWHEGVENMAHEIKSGEVCGIKCKMIEALRSQVDSGIRELDTDEAGKVVDMIKDLAEAEYYCAVTEAMQSYDGGKRWYSEPMRGGDRYRDQGGRHMDQSRRIGDGRERDMRDGEDRDRHGRAFDEYRRDKRHYTATHSEQDRMSMRAHANEHLAETMATLREIWDDADPDLKKRMKADMTKLTAEMEV